MEEAYKKHLGDLVNVVIATVYSQAYTCLSGAGELV